MHSEQPELDPRITRALDELQTLIRQRYPEAQFAVLRDADDPAAIQLTATVEREEPEEVLDVVMDRLLELQVTERLPIHVIPLRPIERLVALEASSLSHPEAVPVNAPHA